ncbi:hypothetical protein BDA96_07G186200, partial [Sorghum bicolor]
MAFHLRSASALSNPRSYETSVKDQLQSIRKLFFSLRNHCYNLHVLRRFGSVFNNIEEIMSLPSSQVNPCQSKKRKAVKDELEHSFLLLDLCSAMQESTSGIKVGDHEKQLIIKRGENAEIEANIQFQSYISFAKTQKQFKKSYSHIILNLIAMQSSRERSLIHKTFQDSRVPCKVEQLEVLEIEIVDLEAGVEALFKKLIQSRFSLLNNGRLRTD